MTNIQDVTSHLPSIINHTVEEYDQAARALGSLLRRGHICVSLDGNVEISDFSANDQVAGRWLKLATERQAPSPSTCEAADALLCEVAAHRLMIWNRFSQSWRTKDEHRHIGGGHVYGIGSAPRSTTS